jgi:hypothetical protein
VRRALARELAQARVRLGAARAVVVGFLLAAAGFAVPHRVSLECAGGRPVTALHRAAWLVVKGVPWLVRRGRDFGPMIVQSLVYELMRRPVVAAWQRD